MRSPRAAASLAALLLSLAGSAAAASPDLTVTAVSGPTQSAAGKTISVTTSVAASSAAAVSTGFRVGIYLSTDAQITTSDVLLGSRTLSKLSAGATSTASTSVTLPAGLVGTYYLGAIVDDLGQVSESNETNNALAGNAIQLLGPDLTISAVSAPSQAGAGATVNVSSTALNAATGPDVGTFRVGIYLSRTSTITTSATLLGSRTVTSLKSGGQSKASTSVQLPVGISGTWYLGAIADDTGLVAETNEANNASTGAAITVLAPDLVVTSSAPSSAGAGAAIAVTTTVTSKSAASGPFKVGIYLSSDSTLTTADTLLGQFTVPGLAAGSGNALTTTTTVSLPLGVSGTWYIGAIVDPDNAIVESSETNNTSSSKITLTAPDLTMTAVSGPTTGAAGASIAVGTTVAAASTGGAAGPFRVGIYLSTDATITTSDVLVGYRDVAGLAPGQSSQATTTVTLPASLAPGVYYLGAIADSTGAVAESNETNNARSGGTIQIARDSTPPVITVTGVADGDVRRDDPLSFCYAATDQSAFTVSADLDGVAQPACGSTYVEGDHVLTVRAVDTYGNAAQTVIHFSLDFTAPQLQLAGVFDGEVTAAASVTPVFGATDAHLKATSATLNGVPWTGGAIAQEGDYVLVLQATDLAGNTSSETIGFAIDRTAALIRVTGVTPGAFYRQPVTPGYELVEAHPATSGMQLDGQPLQAGTAVGAEGAHRLVVSAADAAGNAVSVTVGFTIDRTAPALAVVAPAEGATVSVQSAALVVSATDAGGLQSVTAQGIALAPGADGNYHGTIPLAEGPNALVVTATDLAGNQATATVHVTRDTVPPAITVTGVADGDVRRDNPLPFCATSTDQSATTLTVDLDGVTQPACSSASAEGDHVLTVKAVDAGGNAAQAVIHFALDFTPPQIQVSGVADGQVTNAASVTPVFDATDAHKGSVSAILDGAPWAGGPVTQEGDHVLVVTAVDRAGNTASITIHFAIDRTPPALQVTGVAEGGLYRQPVSPAFTLVEAHPGTSGMQLDGQPLAAGAPVSTDGAHTLVVTATDAAGNGSSATVHFTVDRTPPFLLVAAPAEGATVAAPSVQVVASASDTVGLQGVTAQGIALSQGADGSYRGTVPLVEGSNAVLVVATDVAGNETTATVHVTRDTTPPQLVVTTPADGATVNGPAVALAGMVIDGTSLTVNGQPVALAADGSFHSTLSLAAGDQTLTFVAADAAGNADTETRKVTVQAAAMTLAVSDPVDGFVTSSAHVTVKGTVTGVVAPATADVNGTQAAVAADGSFAVTLDVAVGAVTLSIKVSDAAGHTAQVTRAGTRANPGGGGSGLTVLVDAPTDGAVLPGRVVVSGRIDGGQPPYQVTVLGAQATVSSVYFNAVLNLAEGDQLVSVSASDAAGNGGSAQRAIVVDSTAPYLAITRPATTPSDAHESPYLVEGDVGDLNLAGVTVNGLPASVLAGKFSASVPLQGGPNDVVVTATDLAGNATSRTVHLDVSAVPPTVTIVAPAEGSEAATPTVLVRAQVSGTAAISTVTIGTAPATLVSGAWQATVPLALGANAIDVAATDAAGLTATATVHVTYKNPSSEPLAVTGVDPVPDATGIDSDALVNVSFNKAVDPSTLADHFTVRANGTALTGSFYVAPGSQTVSFIARAPLPTAQRLEVRVDGVSPAAGPGMSGVYTSSFTTRPLRTVFRGVVMDDTYQPVSSGRVTVEGSGASTPMEGDGNWAFVDAQGGTAFVRFEGGVTPDGISLPTVRRRLFVNGDRDTVDKPIFLTPVNTAAAQRIDGASPVHLDFGQRYPGLSLDVDAQGLFFENGQSAGTVTATQVKPMFLPVDVENGNLLTGVWQVQPVGIRLTKPIQVKLPNLTGLPPGRLAILTTWDPSRCMLARTAVGQVSADGTVIASTAPVTADGLDFIGYMGLTADQDAMLRQALGGGSGDGAGGASGGSTAPTTGTNEAPRSSVRRVLAALSWLAGGTARAQTLNVNMTRQLLFGVDSVPDTSLSCYVHGRVRTPYDWSPVSITVRAPNAVQQLRVTLPYSLPVDFDAVPGSDAANLSVTAELTASRDVVLAPPLGQIWASPPVYGTASVQGQVPLSPGTTTTITVVGRSSTDARTAVYEALLTPITPPGGGAPTEGLVTVTKKFDNSDSARPPAAYFAGWAVTADAGNGGISGVSQADGLFSIPLCSRDDAFVCASVNVGTRFQITRDANQHVSYTPISKDLQLCSTAFTFVNIPAFHRSDILVDLRVLAGKLVFKNRDGSAVGGKCDAGAVTERDSDGKLKTISQEDLATTEVHFFREDKDFKDPIARFTVAIPGTQDGTKCDASAHARYQRVRLGPSTSDVRYKAELCAALRYSPDPAAQQQYNDQCASLERTSFTRLSAGDRLVVFAVNHATGWAGMTTVSVPEITQQANLAPGQPCAADASAGGPLVVVDDWSGSSQPFTISRCASNNIFIDAPIDLYPPEIDVRVARRRRDEGVQDQSTRQQHLVRTGGAATTTDSTIQISTNWRVRLQPPGNCPPPPPSGSPQTPPPNPPPATSGPQIGDPAGPKVDPTLAKPTDPDAAPNGAPGEPLEVLCSELPPNASADARTRCVGADQCLAEVPPGVPPLAGHVVRVTGTAVEQPGVSVFRVAPGRSTGNVQTTLRLIQGENAVTLPNLPVANYYVHVVGHSLLFNDLNGSGVIDPNELERRDPPPPELSNWDPAGPPGVPLRSLALKDVYFSMEPDGSMLQRFDRSREHEFQVVSLEKTSAKAVLPDGTTRDLDDSKVDPAHSATAEDVAYQFLLQLVRPDPGRAGTLSGDIVAWLGSDEYGVRCDLTMPTGAATAMSANCGSDYLYDIIAARDVVYFELFYSGNAENVLYRYNFNGLTGRADYVTAGRYNTAKDSAVKDQDDGTPALHREVSRPVGAEFFLEKADLSSGTVTVTTDPDSTDPAAIVKRAHLAWQDENTGYKITDESGTQKAPLVQLDLKDGSWRFHVPIPSDLAELKGNGVVAKDLTLVVEPEPDPTGAPQAPFKWYLGKPHGTFAGTFARAATHSTFHGIDLADGHLSFRQEDLALPEFASTVRFGRTYVNQDNDPGPVGVGWRHDYEGFLVEERVGRYTVVLAGQSYHFRTCATVDVQAKTASGCTTDDSHGGLLTIARTSAGKPDNVFEDAGGWRYRFDQLSVAAGPFAPPSDGKGDPDAFPGRRRWVLTAIDDGHARDPKDVTTDGWVVVTYNAKSDMVAKVARNGGLTPIVFGYVAVPDDPTTDRRLKALARQFNFQFLQTITAGPVTVTLTQDPKNGNLLSAKRSTGDSYEFTYAAMPSGLNPDDAWAVANEIEQVTYRINSSTQSLTKYGRSQATDGFPHERRSEIVDSVTESGYDGKPFTLSGFDSSSARTLTRPDGVVEQITLNPWGAVVAVKTPLSQSSSLHENDSDETKRAFTTGQVLADGRTYEVQPDTANPQGSRLRSKGVTLTSGGSDGAPVTGLSQGNLVSASVVDARFGLPTQATVSDGRASVSTPVSTTGDFQGVTVTDGGGVVAFSVSRQTDANGVVTSETDGVGRITTYTNPDPQWGLPMTASLKDAKSGGRTDLVRTIDRDTFGRVTKVHDDLGRVESWAYDPLGRLLSHTTPVRTDTWIYVESDDELTVTETLGDRVTVKHYADGRLRSEDLKYDATNRSATKTYTWTNGRLTQVVLQPTTPLEGERVITWTYGFDADGRVTSVTTGDQNGSFTSTVTLDSGGKPVQQTSYDGLTTGITYDRLGRAVRWTYGSDYRQVELDVNGAVTRSTFGTHVVTTPTDPLGRTTATQGRGLDTTIERDAIGRVTKQQDKELGVTETYTYDVADRLLTHTRELDSGGKLAEVRAYDDSGSDCVVTVTRTIDTNTTDGPGPAKRVETQTLLVDTAGRAKHMEEVVGEQPAAWDYYYDSAGRLYSVTGPVPWSRKFDQLGAVVSRRDAAGKETDYTVDAMGLVLEEKGPGLERDWTYAYDAVGRITAKKLGDVSWAYAYGNDGPGSVQETGPLGYVTSHVYDAAQRLRDVKRQEHLEHYDYDGSSLQTATTTEGSWNLAVTTAFDDRGRQLSRTESWSGGSRAYTYSTETPWNKRTTTLAETWAAGESSESRSGVLTVDSLGKLVEQTIGGAVDQWTYDAAGLLIQERLAARPPKTWAYSGGVPMQQWYGAGDTPEITTWTYWNTGRVATETEPSGRVRTLGWDPRGMVASSDYGGDSWSYQYDDNGNLQTATHGGSKWTYDYGPRGELRSVTQPGGLGQFKYHRDALTRLKQIEVTPADGVADRTFDYDYLDREVLRTRGPAQWTTSWADGTGTTTLPNGDQQAVLLDGRGRVASKKFSPGSGSVAGLDGVTYEYNGLDDLMRVAESGVGAMTTTYAHDNRGLLTFVRRGGAPEVEYGRRPSGELSFRRVGGTTVSYDYDEAFERVSAVHGPAGDLSIEYEPGGAHIAAVGGPNAYERRCFDGAGRVAQVLHASGPVTCDDAEIADLGTYAYAYTAGLRMSETRSGPDGTETTTYGYDAAERLTGVQYGDHAALYKLAADGTRLGERSAPLADGLGPDGFDGVMGATRDLTYHYDERGALTSVTDALISGPGQTVASYTVDAAGRVQARTKSDPEQWIDGTGAPQQGTRTEQGAYSWDAEGRLRSGSLSVTSHTGGSTTSATYAYDGLGRRVSATGAAGTKTWTWGEDEVLAETPPGASPIVYQYADDLPVAAGNEQFLRDGLGSVVARVGAAAPTSYRYDAWGGFRTGAQPGTAGPTLAYAGQYWDADLGLSYAQQRWYEPGTGRFLSEDPAFGDIVHPTTLLVFGYANGNPLFYTDPRGESGSYLALPITVSPEREMATRRWIAGFFKRWQALWNKHFQDEGQSLASHGDMAAGVTTATGGQFAGVVVFAIPNFLFNQEDAVKAISSLPKRAWKGCGQAFGGSNQYSRLGGAGECSGALGETLTLVVAAGEISGYKGPVLWGKAPAPPPGQLSFSFMDDMPKQVAPKPTPPPGQMSFGFMDDMPPQAAPGAAGGNPAQLSLDFSGRAGAGPKPVQLELDLKRPMLPTFDGRTSGVLVPKSPAGPPVPLQSGPRSGARFPFSQADGHLETGAARWMGENDIVDADVYHNNPKGTCGNCDYYLPRFLRKGSKMTVIPPEDAQAPTPRWIDKPKTYTGSGEGVE